MPDEKDAAAPPPGPPPPADFSSLVASLATGALMALGAYEEEGKSGDADLERAKYAIDLLEVLSAKTKGNLTSGEDRQLSAILHQVRMAFVEASRKPPGGVK